MIFRVSNSIKKFFISLGFIFIGIAFSISLSVLAAAPTGGYNAGDTRNPDCAPGDVDCFVIPGWSIAGNAGTTAGTNFIGTTDAEDLVIKVNNTEIMRYLDNADGAGADGLQWFEGIATGAYATAWGFEATASGDYATAFGESTTASGSASFAGGGNATASGILSFAFGDTAIASGGDSFALGRNNTASGNVSFATGGGTTASGSQSTSMGVSTLARSGFGEMAIGSWNTDYTPDDTVNGTPHDRLFVIGNGASGSRHNAFTSWKDGSFAFNDDNFEIDSVATEQNFFYFNYGVHDGDSNAQTKRAIRMGSADDTEFDLTSANVGDGSIAIGFADQGNMLAPVASGPYSMALGPYATASGINSFAFGIESVASGDLAIAMGDVNLASGTYAVSFGTNNISSGFSSVTFGGGSNTASGEGSIAMGYNGISSGENSFAMGQSALASGNVSFAIGDHTDALGSQSFAIGNTTIARSGFGEIAVGSWNTDYTPNDAVNRDADDRQFVVGNGGGLGLESDAFTILKSGLTGIGFDNFETTADADLLQVNGAILQSTATACTLNADADGTIICTPSDENLKQNIVDLSYGLDTVMQLHPVSYEFINQSFGSGNQIGFIAQELETVIPEVVTTGPDYKSVNYPLLTSVLTKAIQELSGQIDIVLTTITNWLADAGNGITDLFAQRIHVQELCVGNTCLNEAQINAILDATQTSSSSPAPSPAPAPIPVPSPDPTPNSDPSEEPPVPSEPEEVPEPEPSPVPESTPSV